ncbi:hypothetical protein MM239_14860 [Belliella sp. DSM 111904]|uniref:Site-specific DNA-methyltransferase (adenine-specific) n=1 Tax=Belliella filtrata TaxID=2923435 RepID=A0ABS9V2P9_9BACT|nr:hypothetical protein [Belliella filtrata]MCH7410686.1 hypothetical protein [Belliella filtrata]
MKASKIYSHLIIKPYSDLFGMVGLCLFALRSEFEKIQQSDQTESLKPIGDPGLSAFDILFERKPKNPI